MEHDDQVPSLSLTAPAFEPLLDSQEAAALLKIHPKTLQRMARQGEIAAIHLGKLWRFRASVLNKWLESRIAGAGQSAPRISW